MTSRQATQALASVVAACGVILVAQLVREPAGAYGALFSSAFFVISICLGGAILVAVMVLGGARWWTPIHRVPMALAGLLPVPAAAVALTIVAGRSSLFPWSRPDAIAASTILQAKAAWFETPFFLARTIVVLLLWLGLVVALERSLVAGQRAGGGAVGGRAGRISAIFLVLLAPTLSLASWDWAMSLEPEWFSTMYGVYGFAGAFLAGIAAVSVLCCTEPGAVRATAAVRHDLGKLLFAFSAFWAYIWYCQYMLVWYSNIPEETTYYALRQSPEWVVLFWLNPVLNFVIPFVTLMPARTKRQRRTLLHVAVIVLAGRWLDVYLMVMPPVAGGPSVAIVALAATAGLAALAALVFPARLRVARGLA